MTAFGGGEIEREIYVFLQLEVAMSMVDLIIAAATMVKAKGATTITLMVAVF